MTIIPTEIGMPTIQTGTLDQENAELVIKDLDTVDELRDLVLRKVFENTANPAAGKFQPNWEGPYLVTRAGESGSYALDKLDGTPVPRMWNALHLKMYYR